MPALHGFMVEWPLATPRWGFSKSRSRSDGPQHGADLGSGRTLGVEALRLFDGRIPPSAGII